MLTKYQARNPGISFKKTYISNKYTRALYGQVYRGVRVMYRLIFEAPKNTKCATLWQYHPPSKGYSESQRRRKKTNSGGHVGQFLTPPPVRQPPFVLLTPTQELGAFLKSF